MGSFGISVFQCFGMSVLFACSFRFFCFVACFVCPYFVVFCFVSFPLCLVGECDNFVCVVVLSLHFVCLASFRFVLLLFASFAYLLLFFLCVLFVSVLSFVSVFSLFSGDGFDCYGLGLRHQSRAASYGMSLLVPWCRRSLRFVSLAFPLCFLCLLLLIGDLQFYSFVYEVILKGSNRSALVYACVCARCVMALTALLIIFWPCCPKADKGARSLFRRI